MVITLTIFGLLLMLNRVSCATVFGTVQFVHKVSENQYTRVTGLPSNIALVCGVNKGDNGGSCRKFDSQSMSGFSQAGPHGTTPLWNTVSFGDTGYAAFCFSYSSYHGCRAVDALGAANVAPVLGDIPPRLGDNELEHWGTAVAPSTTWLLYCNPQGVRSGGLYCHKFARTGDQLTLERSSLLPDIDKPYLETLHLIDSETALVAFLNNGDKKQYVALISQLSGSIVVDDVKLHDSFSGSSYYILPGALAGLPLSRAAICFGGADFVGMQCRLITIEGGALSFGQLATIEPVEIELQSITLASRGDTLLVCYQRLPPTKRLNDVVCRNLVVDGSTLKSESEFLVTETEDKIGLRSLGLTIVSDDYAAVCYSVTGGTYCAMVKAGITTATTATNSATQSSGGNIGASLTAGACANHQWFDGNLQRCDTCPQGMVPTDDKLGCKDAAPSGGNVGISLTVDDCADHQWFDANLKTCSICPEGKDPTLDKLGCNDETFGGLTELQWAVIGTIGGLFGLGAPASVYFLRRWGYCGGDSAETPKAHGKAGVSV